MFFTVLLTNHLSPSPIRYGHQALRDAAVSRADLEVTRGDLEVTRDDLKVTLNDLNEFAHENDQLKRAVAKAR